ncbi:MAG: universal stress protein [Candidatus Methanomethylophilaceae archaeon]|jgi:nucleotide-binding universal stress UspA family protein
MSFNNILVPTDGSEFTKSAINKSIEMAKVTGATITAVYVLDQSVYSTMPLDSTVVNLYDTLKAEGESAVNYVKEKCDEASVPVKTEIVEGIPSKAITTMSKGYDLIVMGTLGKKGMTKVLMGSVAEKVIEKSQCPVMVISAVANTA